MNESYMEMASTCAILEMYNDITFDKDIEEGRGGYDYDATDFIVPVDLILNASRGRKRRRCRQSSPSGGTIRSTGSSTCKRQRRSVDACVDSAGLPPCLLSPCRSLTGETEAALSPCRVLEEAVGNVLLSPLSVEDLHDEDVDPHAGRPPPAPPSSSSSSAAAAPTLAETVCVAETQYQHLQLVADVEYDHMGFARYANEIYLRKRSMELAFHPIRCLNDQPEVTADMRGVLIAWLTKLCRHFLYNQDTLFLTVNIMDRFLHSTPIARNCFQLLGITTFLISAKQEEVVPPNIEELVGLCRHAYHREQVKQLELIVLNRLHFDLVVPTTQFFLEHYGSNRMQTAQLAGCTTAEVRRTRAVARNLAELCLQDYDMCQFQPSLLALSTLEAADRLLEQSTGQRPRYLGGHSPAHLDHCAGLVEVIGRQNHLEGPFLEVVCLRYAETCVKA